MNTNTIGIRFALLCASILTISAQAATISLSPGSVIIAADGQCSLREALENAEADAQTHTDCDAGAGADTIEMPFSSYTVPDAMFSPVNSLRGLPEITSTVIINGNGSTLSRDYTGTPCAAGTTNAFRFFSVNDFGGLTINNMRLQGGCAFFTTNEGAGGALLNEGTTALNQVTLSNNAARSSGGAIQNDGTLTITSSEIHHNVSLEGAGGGIVNRGDLNISQSSIHDNMATGSGGGIDAGRSGVSSTTTVTSSIIANNMSLVFGGGVYAKDGNVTFNDTTIRQNQSTQTAGVNIHKEAASTGTVSLENSNVGTANGGDNCNFSPDASASGNEVDDNSCGTPDANLTLTTFSSNALSYSGGYLPPTVGASSHAVPSQGLWALLLMSGLLVSTATRRLKLAA